MNSPTPQHPSSDDDDDTGPVQLPRQQAAFDDWNAPREGSWQGRFDAALTVNPVPARRSPAPRLLVGAAGLVVLLVVAGATVWLLREPSERPERPDNPGAAPATSITPDSAANDDKAQTELLSVIPPGYPAGACKPADPPKAAVAQVSCNSNADAGGPVSATYALTHDKEALRAAFDEIVGSSDVVICPGNIQSPGPWRRNATPQQAAGMLVCGFQQGRPTVAWTTDSVQLVSAVHGDAGGPDLDQLYAWWSSHS